MTTPTPIPCRELVELVTDYFEGALPPALRASIDGHLGCCGDCEAYVEQLRETLRVVGHLDPDGLDPGVEERLLGAFRDWQGGAG
jgi:hypothetical protein